MPLAYHILPGRRAIVVQARGTVTAQDHEALVADLMDEPALPEGLPVLVDARGARSTIRARDLPRIVTLTRMLMKRGMDIIAVVADPGPVLTLARAFELAAHASGVQVAVFDDIAAARVWLRLPPEAGGPA